MKTLLTRSSSEDQRSSANPAGQTKRRSRKSGLSEAERARILREYDRFCRRLGDFTDAELESPNPLYEDM